MKISVQTGGPEERFGVDRAYRLIAECGFDAVDTNIDLLASGNDIRTKNIHPVVAGTDEKALLELFKPRRDAAKKYGLDNYQAHAPFPSHLSSAPEYNDVILQMLENMIRGCDFMDCRNLIVHPFFNAYPQRMDAETEWALNIERYSKLIPTAKQYGVTICLENMFIKRRDKVYAACCSNIDTACRYIDTLNGIAGEKCFGFCLDTGHYLLIGGDIKEAMMKLGDRISAFHVHDNNGLSDQHLAPYMGVQDWDRFVEGLKAIGFNKTLSFETFNIWNVVDPELCPTLMRFIAETGRMFARRAQA